MAIRLGGITEDSGDTTRFLQVADIMMSGNGTPRTGFLLCDGSAVSRAVYANLFAAIGINFGPGDGVTTFNLPDFRGRSPMGEGTGSGLSPRVIGDIFGEELHVLSVAELATHTHLQNSHNHTQDAHTHTQNAHTHTQDSHNHTLTDPGHNHTTVDHTHTQDAHNHVVAPTNNSVYANANTGVYAPGANGNTDSMSSGNTTATNQNANVTVQSSTTGVASTATTATNQNATATNQNTTATNQATTATNQNEGSSTGHNTVHPILVVLFQIKF